MKKQDTVIYCRKCGNQLNSRQSFCPKCGSNVGESKSRKINKPKKHPTFKKKLSRKKIIIISSCGVTILIVGLIVGYFALKGDNVNTDPKYVHELTMQCINIKEIDRTMSTETTGTVSYSITLPNFTEIYRKALDKTKNYDKATKIVVKTLEDRDFSTVTCEASADLVIENGGTTIHTDEMIETVLEENLIKAINENAGAIK